MAMHQFAKEEVEEMNKEADHNKVARESEEILKRNNSGPDSRRQIAMESNLVVGALVATVTFTAGLTVPGGFMSNGSEDQGLAVLTNKAAFQAFTVFNTLAFVCSVFPVIHMFHNSLLLRHHIRLRCVRLAEACTTFSIFAMVLAFCSGRKLVE
ncbi:protein ACCELERATED CELL DEATH 6-like [Momordica charantia]|uniref:Protein ACCELERATED CELL DEATH 6-like n=1 Tax=Momordica charantia TaxID=3673 RepID=A0A6J1CMY4_MOMCH|nr:protein ACCELERATED CELL DEATH 6-like [Momordica charantia]